MPEGVVVNAEKIVIIGAPYNPTPGSLGNTITGSSQSETIVGLGTGGVIDGGPDIITGSGGTDTVDGGGHIDTYLFYGNTGGTTTVNDTGAPQFAGTYDRLVLDTTYLTTTSPFMTFDVTRDGSSLTFTFGNETIILQGGVEYFMPNMPLNIGGGAYQIASGSSGDSSLIVGTGADDNLSGSGLMFGGSGDDTLTVTEFGARSYLVGGQGDDALNGSAAYLATYIFRPGDGNDTIIDTSTYEHFLVLDTAGAAFTNLSFYDDNPASNTGNLVIKYGSGGSSDQITITDQFKNSGAAGIDTINFNGASFAGYNLGFGYYDLSHDDSSSPNRYPNLNNGTRATVLIGAEDQSSILHGEILDTAKLMFGGDKDDQLYAGYKSDLMFGGGGADHFVFSLVASSTASKTDVIADFQEGVDSIDFSLLPNVTSFSNLSFVYDSVRNMTVVTDSFTGIVIDLYGQHTLTANDFIFQNISATFIGTSGNDTANANPRALIGFTGGTPGQVSDNAGDTYIPGDGDDIIHAGSGADTVQILASSNISAGDVFDGGGAPGDGIYDVLYIGTGYIDLRPAIIVNFEILAGDDNSNTVEMSYAQYQQFGSFYLGGGTNIVNVYLPDSINSADLATAPTQFDMTSLHFANANGATVNLIAAAGSNQSLKMTGEEVSQFSTIDLGDGAQDALTIMTGSDFALNLVQILNVEDVTIIDGAGSDVITGSNAAEKIYGNAGDDTVMGGGGDDYLDGGTGNNLFKFTTNDGHDTVAYADGGTRAILLQGSPISAPYDAFNITHLDADGLQLTYGNTIIDLPNYTENDRVNVGFAFTNPIPFIYGTASTGWNFHHGLDGNASQQILVGTDGADHINGVGYGNLMFGGDGDDIITGGAPLTGTDFTGLGTNDIFVGGKGDDMLISLGLRDPNFAGGASQTYVFNAGDGHDTIDDRGGGDPQSGLYADRIIIDTKGAALTAFSAVHDSSAANGGNDLVINYSGTDSISVLNQFDGNDHKIESVNFNGASYAGFNFGNIDYSLNKAGDLVINEPTGGSLIVGDLNSSNDITYRSYTGAILIGGNQDDRLNFDAGGGLMIGGGGADTFVFARSQASSIPSVIADFQDGIDKIDMRIQFASTPLVFGSTLTVTETADATLVHADVFGGTIDIKLHGLHGLTSNDFILT